MNNHFFLKVIFSMGCFSVCLAEPQKNDDTHLVSVMDTMDFLLESVFALPNNACLQQILRVGYIHAAFLLAAQHKLRESKDISVSEKKELLAASKVFQNAIKPFLAGYPIANSMFATTDLWQDLDEQRRTYEMMP